MSTDSRYQWSIGSPPPTISQHSLVKHEVLQQYLTRYIKVYTTNQKMSGLKLTLIDGFAGGGQYLTEKNELHPGSPFLMMKAMEEARAEVTSRIKNFKLDIRYVFVEKEQTNIDFLKSLLKESPHTPEQVELIHGSFEDNASAIIEQVKKHSKRKGRSIFLLDQYGYTDVFPRTVKKIFESLPSSEVIWTFATGWLIDYLSVKTEQNSPLRKIGIDPALLLEQTEGDQWRRTIEFKLHKVLKDLTKAKFFTPFFIKSPKAAKSYWLLHLSGHPKARDEMTQLHWSLHNHFAHYGGAGLNMLGYDPEGEDNKQTFLFDYSAQNLTSRALLEDIPKSLEKRRDWVTIGNFIEEHANGTPATAEMMRATLLSLEAEKDIVIKGPVGERRQHNTVSNEDRIMLNKQIRLFTGK